MPAVRCLSSQFRLELGGTHGMASLVRRHVIRVRLRLFGRGRLVPSSSDLVALEIFEMRFQLGRDRFRIALLHCITVASTCAETAPPSALSSQPMPFAAVAGRMISARCSSAIQRNVLRGLMPRSVNVVFAV